MARAADHIDTEVDGVCLCVCTHSCDEETNRWYRIENSKQINKQP